MSRPQNSFQTQPQPQKKPIRAQKVKNDPNIKSKSNATVEGNIENESCSITWVTKLSKLMVFIGPYFFSFGPK